MVEFLELEDRRVPPIPPAVSRVYAVEHDRGRGIPVSERGLVPRENTAFLARLRDSGSTTGEVVV